MGVLGGLILKTRIPRDGLVAEYRFTGNYLDTSGNGYNGVNSGTTLITDRKGNPNLAIDFNGSSNYVDIDAALAGLSTTTKGTWSVWFNKTPIDGANDFILSFGDTNANSRLQIWIERSGSPQPDGAFSAAMINSSTLQWVVRTNSGITVSTWIHVALVQDGVSPVLYIDGVAIAQTFTISTDKAIWFNDVAGLDNGRIGTLNWDNNGNTNWYEGSIDDIRIYDRNLSQAEITLLANE